MHMHKFEKIWLVFGVGALIVFLSVVGVSAFYLGNKPPSCLTTIDPKKVDETAPFTKPGLNKVEGKEWDYELIYVASAFFYNPQEVEVPLVVKQELEGPGVGVLHGPRRIDNGAAQLAPHLLGDGDRLLQARDRLSEALLGRERADAGLADPARRDRADLLLRPAAQPLGPACRQHDGGARGPEGLRRLCGRARWTTCRGAAS